MSYKTESKINYYYSLKDSPVALYVTTHSDYKTTYSTSRLDAKLFKGFDDGGSQPDIEQHFIWQHVETTEYEHRLIDLSTMEESE